MLNIFKIKISTIKWVFPILFLYVLAGSLQYLGIISPTQSNFIVLFLLLHVFQFYSSWRQLKLELPILCFLVLVIILHFFQHPPLSYTLTYFYYLICTMIAAASGRIYLDRFVASYNVNSNKIFFNISKWFLLLQLFMTTIQASFTQSYIDFSSSSIGYEDAVFGTFFLQSDAALATVCELILLAVYILPSKLIDKILITILGVAVIFLGNSKTAQFVVVGLLVILWLNLMFEKLKLYKYGFGILISILVLFFTLMSYSIWSGFIDGFIQQAQYDYNRRDEWVMASRFAPLGETFSKGLQWIGYGPLTYYNPIEKSWLYNSGFSTLYVLYFDYGLVGFILYFFYQFFLILKFGVNSVVKIILFFILLSYMNFNFSLTDISFIFMFNFVLLFLYKQKNRDLSNEVIYVSKHKFKGF